MTRNLYSPESYLHYPFQFLKDMFTSLRASRELAGHLLIRNLRAGYRQSLLGYLWLLLTPLSMALTWILLRAARIISFPDSSIPYAVYVVTGLFLWQVFYKMLNMPLQQLSMSRPLLVRVKLPWEAILLAGVGEILFEFSLYMIVLLGVFIVFQIELHWSMLLGLAVVPIWLLGALALGLLLTPWGMLYDDVSRGLNVLTSLLFFLLPIVYVTPTAWPGDLMVNFNPLAILFLVPRDMLLFGHTSYWAQFSIVTLLVVALFMIGWVIFRLSIPHLIARLSN